MYFWVFICQGACHCWNSTASFPSQNGPSNNAHLNCQHTPKLEFCLSLRLQLAQYMLPCALASLHHDIMPVIFLQTTSQHYIWASLGHVGERALCPHQETPFQAPFIQSPQVIISTLIALPITAHIFYQILVSRVIDRNCVYSSFFTVLIT